MQNRDDSFEIKKIASSPNYLHMDEPYDGNPSELSQEANQSSVSFATISSDEQVENQNSLNSRQNSDIQDYSIKSRQAETGYGNSDQLEEFELEHSDPNLNYDGQAKTSVKDDRPQHISQMVEEFEKSMQSLEHQNVKQVSTNIAQKDPSIENKNRGCGPFCDSLCTLW